MNETSSGLLLLSSLMLCELALSARASRDKLLEAAEASSPSRRGSLAS